MSTRVKQVAVTREAVRGAALALFAERGYRATTMADIGAALGVRGPSLYKHIASKQQVLREIAEETMRDLLDRQRRAVAAGGPVPVRLRRVVEAHVRYHATHREQALVGHREMGNLDEPVRSEIAGRRREYERGLRVILEEGIGDGVFAVPDVRLASFAILDMGIGVAAWYRADGEHDVDSLTYAYADMALRMLTLTDSGASS